ncbi:MAG: hypothetical protein IJ083_17610 [Clostridia bacterium]|nr:hypothetical protein [Clostridia bacterium]
MNTAAFLAVAAGSCLISASASARPRMSPALPSFRGICEVRSSLPGRMRLYIPSSMENPSASAAAAARLHETGVIKKIRLNPYLGTFLVEYDPNQVEAAVLEGAILKLLGLDEQIQKKQTPLLQEHLHTLTLAVDRAVMDTTGGWIDLGTAASGTLLYLALRQGARMGFVLPGAATLLWWASNIARRGGEKA